MPAPRERTGLRSGGEKPAKIFLHIERIAAVWFAFRKMRRTGHQSLETTPQAQRAWISPGSGALTVNQRVPLSAYPDDESRALAKVLVRGPAARSGLPAPLTAH